MVTSAVSELSPEALSLPGPGARTMASHSCSSESTCTQDFHRGLKKGLMWPKNLQKGLLCPLSWQPMRRDTAVVIPAVRENFQSNFKGSS